MFKCSFFGASTGCKHRSKRAGQNAVFSMMHYFSRFREGHLWCRRVNIHSHITRHFDYDYRFLDITFLLTPRSKVLLEKLTGSQLVKKFPAFYGNRRLITAFRSYIPVVLYRIINYKQKHHKRVVFEYTLLIFYSQ